jgi:hypothetical protein
MAEQDWLSPNSPVYDPAPPPPPLGGYDLRPLSVGEILDRVFSLYRGHFWFFAGLSAASAGVNAVLGILRLVYMHFTNLSVASPSHTAIIGASSVVQGLLYLVAYSVTLAATTFAVNAFYLGRPTSLGESLTVARGIWPRCLGIAIWQGWSAGWVFLLLLLPLVLVPVIVKSGGAVAAGAITGLIFLVAFVAGGVYGVIAYIRNSLALPAAVIENTRVRPAMRRSKQLVAGRKGRIFLLFLLVWVLWMVAVVIQSPFIFLAARAGAAQLFLTQGIILGINFIVTTIVGPIAAIGLCLFYFDERVRREGFDIEMLLQGAGVAIPPLPEPSPPEPYQPDPQPPAPPQPELVTEPVDNPQPAPEQS